jgi:hypothetical protein
LFMNNLPASGILTGTWQPMSGRAAPEAMPTAGNPRQIRLGEERRVRRAARCPQILWIKVCVSCKFDC